MSERKRVDYRKLANGEKAFKSEELNPVLSPVRASHCVPVREESPVKGDNRFVDIVEDDEEDAELLELQRELAVARQEEAAERRLKQRNY
ncbi:hypothetical protein ACF0H5_015260 [Mactra antiquata]